MSGNHTGAARVHWASGKPVGARGCCTLQLLLASVWFGHLTREELVEQGRSSALG